MPLRNLRMCKESVHMRSVLGVVFLSYCCRTLRDVTQHCTRRVSMQDVNMEQYCNSRRRFRRVDSILHSQSLRWFFWHLRGRPARLPREKKKECHPCGGRAVVAISIEPGCLELNIQHGVWTSSRVRDVSTQA